MTNRRAAIWFAVFTLVVFAAGLASGVPLDRVLGAPPFIGAFGGWRGGPNPARQAGRLTRELSLTSEQSAKVQAIFESRRDKVRQMHRDLRRRAPSFPDRAGSIAERNPRRADAGAAGEVRRADPGWPPAPVARSGAPARFFARFY